MGKVTFYLILQILISLTALFTMLLLDIYYPDIQIRTFIVAISVSVSAVLGIIIGMKINAK